MRRIIIFFINYLLTVIACFSSPVLTLHRSFQRLFIGSTQYRGSPRPLPRFGHMAVFVQTKGMYVIGGSAGPEVLPPHFSTPLATHLGVRRSSTTSGCCLTQACGNRSS